MKLKLWFLATTAVAMALALVGFLRDVNTTRATMPLPVQPFASKSIGGLNTTQLGQKISEDRTVSQVLQGERTNSPWIFSGPGFFVDLDKTTPVGTDLGTVEAQIDVGCDGTVDHLWDNCSTGTPLHWYEATTVVQGTNEDYLVPAMPPYSWLLRQKADIDHVCFGVGTATSISVLNTVYTTIPFSPNGGAGVAATLLGGAPNGPPSLVCLDSPNTSISKTSTLTNPLPETDLDRPCNPALNQCADAGIYGMWTNNTVQINGPFPAATTITVEKRLVNNGPNPGYFREHWDAESTNPNIIAEWSAGSPRINQDLVLPVNIVAPTPPMSLQIACGAPGWGLVVLKNILWPLPVQPGNPFPLNTKDTYLDDNAMTFVVLVKCGTVTPTSLVDKEVAYIKTDGPDHIPLSPGGSAPILIDELKENHATTDQAGQEWLVAEAPDVILPAGPDITVAWGPAVTVEAPGKVTQTPPVTDCTTTFPDACITFPVNEWPGQADVHAQLNVMCSPAIPAGLYPVVIKAIDLPTAVGAVESKPSDNAQRKVIYVWCGGENPDGIDDAAGLYPRWTIYKSIGASQFGQAGDLRKPYQSPPSFPSDTGYVERVVQLECFWMDSNGCDATHGACDGSIPGNPADGVIGAAESWNDPDLLALGGIGVVDSDGDCLVDPAVALAAQPGHPVDPVDAPSGTMCDTDPNWVNYIENPVVVHNDKSADQDCDGLVDGIEKAWGSNPLVADSDGDGSRDFVEMFQFTTPVNPDTDGDGYKDKPAGTYGDNTDVTVDNCPSVANPTQVNTDGHRRDNGPNLPGLWASNPAQDKLGDACDSDSDNDGATDGYETTIGTNKLLVDTDGDTVNDGAEARRLANGDLTADPLNAAKKPAWNNTEQVYYRGCHINVNDTTYPAFVPYLPSPSTHVEMDLDGDGVVCPTDADSDNGHANKTEILDKYEAYGYNLSIANADTDGDGCDDWIEIMDINGDRTSDSGDQGRMNRRIAGIIGPNAISDLVFDVNKDGFVDAGDQGSLNRNICSTTKNWGGCPVCGSEN
jgi:hypothetical protein